jgi:hypothetical protein
MQEQITINDGDVAGFNDFVARNIKAEKGDYGDTYARLIMRTASEWINLATEKIEKEKMKPREAVWQSISEAFKYKNLTMYQAYQARNAVWQFFKYTADLSEEEWKAILDNPPKIDHIPPCNGSAEIALKAFEDGKKRGQNV